ncbi:MAG: dUTP diphosphatase [Alphaproteobacteria bacterium]|jgi:dUTP pyrophosphatase|nr:dUTP diphosphatase [Alphaproteobacteria bacterium]
MSPSAVPEVAVAVRRLPHGADLPLPSYATAGSAGLDLRAAVTGPLEIPPGEWRLVPTGLSIALPDAVEAQVRPRSGLAHKCGVTVLNSPGTIDCDYRGEIGVVLINHGRQPFRVARGDRIAQLVVAPVARAVWREVETLETSGRAAGGFGSTG